MFTLIVSAQEDTSEQKEVVKKQNCHNTLTQVKKLIY
jgi:hypothetical protein